MKPTAILIATISLISLFSLNAAAQCITGDCANGTGTMVLKNGDRYEGRWKNGTMNGDGVMTAKNGTVSSGKWKEGKLAGKGVITWPQGDRYEGEFLDGKRDGKGTMSWKKGNRYEGQWKNDAMDGRGAMHYADGRSEKGTWKEGVQVEDASGAPNLTGPWGLYCKKAPVDDGRFDNNTQLLQFYAAGRGTFQSLQGDRAGGNFAWKLTSTQLVLTFFQGNNKYLYEQQYSYDAGKKYFSNSPVPFGPRGTVMSTCILKKR